MQGGVRAGRSPGCDRYEVGRDVLESGGGRVRTARGFATEAINQEVRSCGRDEQSWSELGSRSLGC
jgi:hypothetical protein